VAPALRLWHLGFGLPSLNDPDEAFFVMTALDMLREGRLNPCWFGHLGTLLFYLLAMVIVAVAATGSAIGAVAFAADRTPAVRGDARPVEVSVRREPPHTSSSPR
jgi:hypothetical protein